MSHGKNILKCIKVDGLKECISLLLEVVQNLYTGIYGRIR